MERRTTRLDRLETPLKEDPLMNAFNPRLWPAEKRQWVYRSGLAAIALLLGYQIISPEHAPLWADLLANILGFTGATAAAATADRTLKHQRADGTVQ